LKLQKNVSLLVVIATMFSNSDIFAKDIPWQ
jgi:hypothetical protein